MSTLDASIVKYLPSHDRTILRYRLDRGGLGRDVLFDRDHGVPAVDGRLSDLFGQKQIYLLGFLTFTLAPLFAVFRLPSLSSSAPGCSRAWGLRP